MCSSEISNMIDRLESGGYPTITFYAGANCGQGQFPIDDSFWQPSVFGTPIPAATICPPGLNKLLCPVPFVTSMVFAPGLKVEFFSNNVGPDKVKEFGKTNFYTDDSAYATTAHIPNMSITSGQLTWNSLECGGDKNACSNTENCNTPTDSKFFDTDGKLLTSMISCNSPLWVSFIGINTAPYLSGTTPDAFWSQCNAIPDKPTPPDEDTKQVFIQDFCVQAGFSVLENIAYQSVRPDPDDQNNCGTQPGFAQACGVLGTEALAIATTNRKSYNDATNIGGCNTTLCGACLIENDAKGIQTSLYSCTATDDNTFVSGSTKQIQISFANSDNKVVTWEELQTQWCTKGVSIAGISISRYTNGTPTCDAIMEAACSNTAHLTINPELDTQCTCVNEQKSLEARFADLNIPSQCFSAVCNIANNTDVYKLHSQLSGCSARLCSQVLSIHGSSIFLESSESIICNGTVYSVSDVPDVSSVPLVSQVQPSYGAYTLGPTFYIVLGVLVMLFVVSLLWGIRAIRAKSREKKLAQEKFELELNKRSI